MTRRISIMFVFLLVMQTVLSGLNLQTVLAEGKNKGDLKLSLESVKNGEEVIDIENYEAEEDVDVEVSVAWKIDGFIEAGTTKTLELPEKLVVEEQSGDIVVDANLLINDDEKIIELDIEEYSTKNDVNNDESSESDTEENSEINENSDVETNSEQENSEDNTNEDNLEKETTEGEKTIGHFSVSKNDNRIAMIEVEITEKIEVINAEEKIKFDGKLLAYDEQASNSDKDTDNEFIKEGSKTKDTNELTDGDKQSGNQPIYFGFITQGLFPDYPITTFGNGGGLAEGKFTLTETMVTDLSGSPFTETNPFDPDGEFRLAVAWELGNGHGFVAGDTVSFDLPPQLKINEEVTLNLEDNAGFKVATVVIDTDNKATLTFTEFVVNSSNVSGEFQLFAEIDKDKTEENNGKIEIDKVGEEGTLEIPINMSERKKDVQKNGIPERNYEAGFIDWEVTVNTGRVSLENASITDVLPPGVAYEAGSLKVYKQVTSVNGKVLDTISVSLEDLTTSTENGEITVGFGDITEQYLVTYRTNITDEDIATFKNKVTFKTNVEPDKTAEATVNITRGEPLTKQSTAKGFDPKTGIIEWEIEFNYNQKQLNGVDLTDTWTIEPFRNMTLVDGEVVFTEMTIDENGVATSTENVGLPVGAQVVETVNGFEVTGITTDKPYKITYKTHIDGRVIDELDIANTAGFGPHEVEGDGPGTIGKYYGSKSAGTINYTNKTVNWLIELNHDAYPMGNIVIEDTLGAGLTLVDGSFGITVDGQSYTGAAPDITINGQQFTMTFPADFVTDKKVDITYQTTFDPNKVPNNEPTNSAVIKWTPGPTGDELSGNVSAKTNFNDETENMHWKSASYDPAEKEITWEMIVNYRENEFDNLIIKDELQSGQILTPYDFEVYELNIAANGEYTNGNKLTLTGGNPVITDNEFKLTIGATSKAYKITYKTSLADLTNVDQTYSNEANVFDGSEKLTEEPLEAEAGIFGDKKYASKSGSQENNSKFADWKILVNIAQEKIVDLKLTDTASSNQEYLEHTIKVFEVKYVDGVPVKDEDNELDSSKYEVTINEAATLDDPPSFVLEWKETVERAFIVEYSTLFFAGHNATISNNYIIEGNTEVLSDQDEDNSSSITIRQTASGSATGKSGRLVIQKNDTTYDFSTGLPKEVVLAGIEFDLVDINSNRVVKTRTTDATGKLDFGRLLFGQYKLVEKNPPAGYIVPDQNKIITIDKDYTADLEEHTVEIDNYEPVYAVELTKVDSVDTSLKLVGAVFSIYESEADANANINSISTETTNEEGYIVFNLEDSDKKNGTYFVKEITPPQYYEANDRVYRVTIGSQERTPVNIGNVENTLIPGKGELRKIDDKQDGDLNYVGLSGAVFEVKNTVGTVVDTFTTGSGGIGTTNSLPPGSYKVTEKTPPTGFTGSAATFYLEIPKAETSETYPITATDVGTERADVENTVKRSKIQITKQDSENSSQKIVGVTFKITDYDGTDYDGRYDGIFEALTEAEKTAVTNATGIAEFNNLPPGTYTIVEDAVPTEYGYIPDTKPIIIPVGYDDVDGPTPVTETKTNKPLAKVTLEKMDSDSDYLLSGAVFTLWKDDTQVTDHYGKDEFTTGTNGQFVITGLLPGNYELREVTAPNGYVIDEADDQHIRSFVVPEVGDLDNPDETEIIDFTQTAINTQVKNDIVKGSVELTKVDGDDTLFLDGVVFELEATELYNVPSGNYDTFLADYNANELADSYTTENGGKISIEDLRPGKYEFTEIGALDGYQPHTWGDPITFEITITNTQVQQEVTVENYKLVDIPVEKIWEDNNDATEARPNSIEVQLYKDGTAEGTPVTLDYSNDWQHRFKDLEVVRSDGDNIEYTVDEVDIDGNPYEIDGYGKEITGSMEDGFTITNTRSEEITISGKKTWVFGYDGKQYIPDSITIKLLANGELEKEQTISVTSGDDIDYSFTDLPRFDEGGVEIEYSIEEVDVDGFTSVVTDFNVTNTQETTDVIVTKIWDEVDPQYRPETINIVLKADGIEVADISPTIDKVSDESNWIYTFANLPKYNKAGDEIVYTAEEPDVPNGYTSKVDEEDALTITNTQATTSIPVTKKWVEKDSQHRPNNITLQVKIGDDVYRSHTLTGDVDEDEWTYTFEDLPTHDASRNPIVYTVDEVTPEGYEKLIDGYEITNTQLTTSIPVTKKWVEEDNQYRPDDITLQVKIGDDIYRSHTLSGDAIENEWIYTFEDLPTHDAFGNKIVYTVDEVTPAGYEKSVFGNDITNTQIVTDILVTKKWVEEDSQYRPDDITLQVKIGDDVYQSYDLSGDAIDDEWTYTFENLPKYDRTGTEIEYTVDEVTPIGYEKSISGNVITNTQDITEIEVIKIWHDDNNATGERPDKIKVNILQNGDFYNEYEVSSDNDWTKIITLPKYDSEGHEHAYTISEHDVAGYASEKTDFMITNTRTDKKDIEITKTWLDDNAEDRPTEIDVTLSRTIPNGTDVEVDTYTLTAADGWRLSITDLPSFDPEGKAYTYVVEEKDVPEGYETLVHGFDITNVRVGMTSLNVQKSWENDEGTDYRPTKIKVDLLQNGEVIETATITEKSDWKYTFANIEKYNNEGEEYEYSIEEHAIKEYDASITEAEDGFEITNTLKEEYALDSALVGKDEEDGKKVPKTATPYYNLMLIGLLLMALGALYIVWQKTKRAKREI